MFQLRPIHLSVLLALGLTACGGNVTGTGTGTTSGTLEDGLVAGATVFCDGNRDGVLDNGESSTVTDDIGEFTFASACQGDIVSVAGTGIDTDTGTTPIGSMRAVAGSRVVSPMTTMAAHAGLTVTQAKELMAALGLGAIDPGSVRLADLDEASRMKARAAIKVMNDLSTVLVSHGSYADGETAYKAVSTSIAQSVRAGVASQAGYDLYATNHLGTVIQAAIPRNVDSSVRDLVVGTLQSNASGIAHASDEESSRRQFASAGATEFIEQHRSRPSDVTTYPKTDDLHAVSPRFEFTSVVLSPASGTAQTLTANEVAAGTATTAFTPGDLDAVSSPVTAVNVRKLPTVVSVAIELTQSGGSGKLQFGIDKVRLSQGTDGAITTTVPVGAKFTFYARTSAGVSIEPAGDLVNATENTASGLNIPIGLVKAKAAAAGIDASQLASAFALSGKYAVRVTVSNTEVRKHGGAAASVETITVGKSRRRAFPGYSFKGAITFGASAG